MPSKRTTQKGFTLIEVTLAIVIGIIMIAGATLIYNQAKVSAGNSRAQAKVTAFMQLCEEFSAANSGFYPGADMNQFGGIVTGVGGLEQALGAMWARKRSDDWNKSPWGGSLGTNFNPGNAAANAFQGVRVQGANTALGGANAAIDGSATAGAAVADAAGRLFTPTYTLVSSPGAGTAAQIAASIGGLFYDFNVDNTNGRCFDIMQNTTGDFKGYCVFVADQSGRLPNFVVGPKVI